MYRRVKNDVGHCTGLKTTKITTKCDVARLTMVKERLSCLETGIS